MITSYIPLTHLKVIWFPKAFNVTTDLILSIFIFMYKLEEC